MAIGEGRGVAIGGGVWSLGRGVVIGEECGLGDVPTGTGLLLNSTK